MAPIDASNMTVAQKIATIQAILDRDTYEGKKADLLGIVESTKSEKDLLGIFRAIDDSGKLKDFYVSVTATADSEKGFLTILWDKIAGSTDDENKLPGSWKFDRILAEKLQKFKLKGANQSKKARKKKYQLVKQAKQEMGCFYPTDEAGKCEGISANILLGGVELHRKVYPYPPKENLVELRPEFNLAERAYRIRDIVDSLFIDEEDLDYIAAAFKECPPEDLPHLAYLLVDGNNSAKLMMEELTDSSESGNFNRVQVERALYNRFELYETPRGKNIFVVKDAAGRAVCKNSGCVNFYVEIMRDAATYYMQGVMDEAVSNGSQYMVDSGLRLIAPKGFEKVVEDEKGYSAVKSFYAIVKAWAKWKATLYVDDVHPDTIAWVIENTPTNQMAHLCYYLSNRDYIGTVIDDLEGEYKDRVKAAVYAAGTDFSPDPINPQDKVNYFDIAEEKMAHGVSIPEESFEDEVYKDVMRRMAAAYFNIGNIRCLDTLHGGGLKARDSSSVCYPHNGTHDDLKKLEKVCSGCHEQNGISADGKPVIDQALMRKSGLWDDQKHLWHESCDGCHGKNEYAQKNNSPMFNRGNWPIYDAMHTPERGIECMACHRGPVEISEGCGIDSCHITQKPPLFYYKGMRLSGFGDYSPPSALLEYNPPKAPKDAESAVKKEAPIPPNTTLLDPNYFK